MDKRGIEMVKVRVPATSANIGPGFDCLGVALDLYNYFTFEIIDCGLEFRGCDEEFMSEDNLIYTSFKYTCEKLGLKLPSGLRISIENNIPISRGLGSSATCIVGGILGAVNLLGEPIDKKLILEIATDIEGHPDNVAPAIYGGFTISIMDNDDIHFTNVDISKDIKFCPLIPNFKLSTAEARGVLPKEIPYKDGVFNVGRVAMLIAALQQGNFDVLGVACDDKLHQPYRGTLIKDFDMVIDTCKDEGAKAVFLSGAGPTIMNIVPWSDFSFKSKVAKRLDKLDTQWKIMELQRDLQGAVVI